MYSTIVPGWFQPVGTTLIPSTSFEKSFGAMELYSEFLTVLGSSVPQCQLENDKFELESLDTIFGTTYSMPWLLLTICLGDSLEATCSDSMFETDRMPVI